ncbi:hypothetical protein ONS95_002848 [Cadophora gregata]|uniref:uncharacterized protein n=1 Tax=Cadophora gregata TaxID=51156 RepID=UPI0026DA829A|nr:uncharacterized protein ONS95_002848 [Cadophora gregata]KAK0108023.1 hypothetical protein ONS95_002848 [Cadophora gregata]
MSGNGQNSSNVVSDHNRRPNPATAGGTKRNPDIQDGRPKKQVERITSEETNIRKEIDKSEDLERILEQTKDWISGTHGSGYPNHKLLRNWWTAKAAELVVCPVASGSNAYPQAKFFHGFKIRYVAVCGAPALMVMKNGHMMVIHSQNVAPPPDQSGKSKKEKKKVAIFAESDHPISTKEGEDSIQPQTLISAFNTQHCAPGLTEEDAAAMIEFGLVEKTNPHVKHGLICTTFKTTETFWMQTVGKAPCPEFEELLTMLKDDQCFFTFVQNKRDFIDRAHEFWRCEMEKCVVQGVWSYYNDMIGTIQGQLFSRWEKDPNKTIKHQTWMKIEQLRKDRGKIQKYASHAMKKSFGSMRELEIVQSVALIYEAMYENSIISMYFAWDKYHEATVVEATNGYVQLDVNVGKNTEYSMPGVDVDTRFKVRKVNYQDSDLVMEDAPASGDKPYFAEEEKFGANDESDPEEDILPQEKKQKPQDFGKPVEKEQPVPTHTGQQFEARVISGGEQDFRLSFFVKDKATREQFVAGEVIKVSLFMTRNPIPSRRSLKAIGKLCKKPGKKDGFKFKSMQTFLKGAGVPPPREGEKSLWDTAMEVMTDIEKSRLERYMSSFPMNGPQLHVWTAIFKYRNFVTQLQGPPGTGKTRTVAIIAMTFALTKARTALCAPSNTAAEECLRNVLEHLKVLYQLDPTAQDDFKVVYVPTTASTKEALASLGEEHIAYDMFKEGEGSDDDPFKQFKLHAHVVRSFEKRASLKLGDYMEAESWLKVLERLRADHQVKPKLMRQFVDLGMAEGATVLQDPNVKIVVSTSSSADLLADYQYKPHAIIIDESASATEQESLVPLALLARYNVLVGDHEQLKPTIRSKGHNEYGSQYGMSIYKRMYDNHGVPLYRLKINYRMHPDIAELPGILTYEWLGCDPSTKVDSDAYRYFQDWYFESELGGVYDEETRDPQYGGEADEDIRVRWLNIADGFASPKPGSTSLRNYANINAAIMLVLSLLKHHPSDSTIPDLKGSDITILSPYRADLEVMRTQLAWAIEKDIGGVQNQIVILLIPPHDASHLGFMREWNRFNVALTRAKSVLYIFGNFDGLRSQLKVISKGMGCKKLALMLVDYMDKGRVIDFESNNVLPASREEAFQDVEKWTDRQQRPSPVSMRLSQKLQDIQKDYTGEGSERFELELLNKLQKLRAQAAEHQKDFEAGRDLDLPLSTSLDTQAEGEG